MQPRVRPPGAAVKSAESCSSLSEENPTTAPSGVRKKATPEQRRKEKDRRLRRTYGISIEDYEARLAAQNNACAICKRPFGKKRVHVDHDNLTGKVRGLLDYRCNSGILFFCQDEIFILLNAVEYLRSNLEGNAPHAIPQSQREVPS